MPRPSDCYLSDRATYAQGRTLLCAQKEASLWLSLYSQLAYCLCGRVGLNPSSAQVQCLGGSGNCTCQQTGRPASRHRLRVLSKPSLVLSTLGCLYVFTGVLNHLRQKHSNWMLSCSTLQMRNRVTRHKATHRWSRWHLP